jgi:uroporphyrinogen-III synthase
LLLSGEGHGRDLAATLRAAGFRVIRRLAYATAPAARLPPRAVAMLRAGGGHALFFSPQTARVFVRLLAASPAPVDSTVAIAISEATAAALAPLPWAGIRVASHPNQDAMLALLP